MISFDHTPSTVEADASNPVAHEDWHPKRADECRGKAWPTKQALYGGKRQVDSLMLWGLGLR